MPDLSARIWDPRTQLHLHPHHRNPDQQCAAMERGYFCTVRTGHDGWHAAYGTDPSKGTLHIWADPDQLEGKRA